MIPQNNNILERDNDIIDNSNNNDDKNYNVDTLVDANSIHSSSNYEDNAVLPSKVIIASSQSYDPLKLNLIMVVCCNQILFISPSSKLKKNLCAINYKVQ